MLFSQNQSKSIYQSLLLSALFILFGLVVSACSFAPVYSNQANQNTKFNVSFADSESRLEQIVYSDLLVHFGQSGGSPNQHIKVSISSSSISPGANSVALSALITVTHTDTQEIIFTGTRTASASYASSTQSLTNQQAANEASARAAHQLAQSVKLTLLGVLSAQVSQ